MTLKLRPASLALALLVLGAAPAGADILVVENGANDVLRVTPGGAQSTFATANLDSPIGIAADAAGNVYVVNQGASSTSAFTNSVAKFTSAGTASGFYATPATPPGNTLNAPVGIAFDGAGNGYVTSNALPNPPFGYVAQYNAAGTFQTAFGAANTNAPSGVGYNPVNGLLYVVNSSVGGGPNPNSFLIYNPANIAAAPTIVTPTGAGALDGGQQVTFDQNGNVFIASFGTASGIPVSRIQEYTAAGAYVRTVATTTSGAEGVAYDPTTNTLYASYLGNGPTATSGYIEKYTFNGTTFTDAGALATGLNGPAFLLNISTSVPEPGSVVLAGLGLVGLAGYRAFRKDRSA